MDYFEGKERFWEKRQCHLFGSLGVKKQMQKDGMGIRQEQEHSEEFLGMISPELENIRNNQRFQSIYKILSEREVDKVRKYDGVPTPARSVRPSWYYIDWLAGQKRRFLPHKWEHDF